MTNCPNCGAPVYGGRCEYCGTVFARADCRTATLYANNVPVVEISETTWPNGAIQQTVRDLQCERTQLAQAMQAQCIRATLQNSEPDIRQAFCDALQHR